VKSSWTFAGPGASFAAMRMLRGLALIAVLGGLAGCSCLPGVGTAQNALKALDRPTSSIIAKDEIPSKGF